MNFEQVNVCEGKNDGMGFPIVNEDISAWREVLGDISVERAGGICSGGEVSFFTILPHVEKELVLIDCNYHSLYFAIGKYHLIEKVGAKAAYELIVSSNKDALKPIFDEANAELPTKRPPPPDYTKYDPYVRKSSFDFYAYWESPKALYEDITQEAVAEFEANKDKTTILHGDLDDLVDRGPFDLLYLSNALQYQSYRRTFRVDEMVKPGGYVAYCQTDYQKPPLSYEVLAESGNKKSYGIRWKYKLCKAPEKEVENA